LLFPSGCVCIPGILGCTGLWGFLSFIGFYSLTSLSIFVLKMKGDPCSYTMSKSTTSFFFDGAQTYGLSFVLFWTLSYALVYIY
ncbi:unnamed protein product, partial [Heterosigma akashiwo]